VKYRNKLPGGMDMDHSEILQQAGYGFLDALNDEVNHSPAIMDYEKVLQQSRKLVNQEQDAHIKSYLVTLSEVIYAYLLGRASKDALEYYLSEQFNIVKTDIEGLIKGIVQLKNKDSDFKLFGL